MKKTTAILLVFTIMLGLSGCGAQTTGPLPELLPDQSVTIKPDPEIDISRPELEETEKPEGTEEPVQPWTWPTDIPENQGLSQAALDAVHATFDTFPLQSSVIVRNGYLVDTYYKDGYADSVFVLNSASKSITSALIGIAIDLGYIESVDIPLSDYFPQVLEYEDTSWRQITLWHLLTHTSGIRSTDNALWEEWRGSNNWIDYILALPIDSEPGSAFDYSTGNTHLLSAILEQATGMSMYNFGKKYLFDPVGMDSVQIETDPQGIADGGNGICLTTSDMARFGWLYLNSGSWEGQQIVPSEWVEQSTGIQFKRSAGSADYGYQWWVRTFGYQNYDAFFAQGHAGQYIFVVPQLQLVVAFNSDYTGATGIYWSLMEDIVNACQSA